MSDTPITDAATYAGWIKVDNGTNEPWHTDRQEWTKAETARQLERELAFCKAAHAELVRLAGGPPLPGMEKGEL